LDLPQGINFTEKTHIEFISTSFIWLENKIIEG